MASYEAVIGMEVHAQLLTNSKVFCGCDAAVFGADPNTHVCPVCLGMPGVLPVANQRAVEQTIMVGLALHCDIAETAVFSRKNYFYPDLRQRFLIRNLSQLLFRYNLLCGLACGKHLAENSLAGVGGNGPCLHQTNQFDQG